MDALKATRILAMRAVLKSESDVEYQLREMQRWFSREFHTELTIVEDLPIEYVAQHYYECLYADMKPEDREDVMKELIETEAQTSKRLRDEEAAAHDDDDFFEQQVASAANAAKGLANALEGVAKDQAPIIPVPVMGSTIPTSFDGDKPDKIPEGIKMDFISEEEMEEVNDWDLFGPVKG